ncbi:hypothetical protein GGI21_000382 [Coemansia aciculifera]|nr:hypothetical protein GGI21_000382 [Coemansia aciculifera]
MSIASDHAQLQRQLYLLGYSQTLPEDGVVLVSTLLKDLQTSLSRVKELESNCVRLERDERTSRLGHDKAKSELHVLRTENNTLRVQILQHTREQDKVRREARADQYRLSKVADDLRMANLQLKAENAERLRALGECQKRAEARMTETDPRGRIQRVTTSNRKIPPSSSFSPSSKLPTTSSVQPAIVDLVDLSSRRISALEQEIGLLEDKLANCHSELKAAQMDVKERDLEILRLHSDYDRITNTNPTDNAASAPRLAEQVEYLHERAEALEREIKDQRDQFAREKEELQRRWAHNSTTAHTEQQQQQPAVSSPTLTSDDDVDRLRTECANIKSLYAQTRDQLQELLRSGNAEQRQAVDKARAAEEASQAAIRELPELRKLSESRGKQIAALEDRLRAAETSYLAETSRLSEQVAQSSESASKYQALLTEFQQLVEQHRTLDKSLKQAVKEVGEWRAKADEREHRMSELGRRADEYKLLYRQTSSELGTCKRTLEAFTSDLATLRDSHANDQREVERLSGELQQALRMRQAVEMSKDEYKAGLAKALAENEAHRSLVAHLQAERSALRVQVKAQFHLSQRLEQRLESLDPTTSNDSTGSALAHPLPLSRSSSAAHSSRSFHNHSN